MRVGIEERRVEAEVAGHGDDAANHRAREDVVEVVVVVAGAGYSHQSARSLPA